jgi:hypothetical protein
MNLHEHLPPYSHASSLTYLVNNFAGACCTASVASCVGGSVGCGVGSEVGGEVGPGVGWGDG